MFDRAVRRKLGISGEEFMRRWDAGYYYALRELEGSEIVAYHWHPGRRSPIDFPHLHLGAGSGIGREELQKAHVPTGRVDLEDVLLMAIREFGVRPRREDWARILGA
jgi:hypothetical protein